MDKYYYFVSQLPFLKFDEKPYISREYFLNEARKWLGPKEFDFLHRTDLNDFYLRKDDPPVLRNYKNFEKSLREELAQLRGALRGQREYRLSEILRSSFVETSPLETERRLLRLRWSFLEEEGLGHYFDLVALIIYLLKLQILERLFTFDKEKGTAIFDALSEVKESQNE